ncbi:MAG: glycosyltransferase family 2 protein [Ignavibacteria bacterium]
METGTKVYGISVILTLFNSKVFLKRALDSVINQTYKDCELIIVDDGSDDDTETILFPILKKNDNFKYIRHSNRKHPLSLNTGIINTSGQYITFLDSDDEYLCDHLELRFNFLNENTHIDILHSHPKIIGTEEDRYVPDARDNSKLIHLKDCVIGGTFFGKRKVFEELQGFENIYSHDFHFFKRANSKFTVLMFDSPTYIYHRDNPESVISKMKERTNIQ